MQHIHSEHLFEQKKYDVDSFNRNKTKFPSSMHSITFIILMQMQHGFFLIQLKTFKVYKFQF